jgi:hypothetical protein
MEYEASLRDTPASYSPLLLFSASSTSLQIIFVRWLDHNISAIDDVSSCTSPYAFYHGSPAFPLQGSRDTPPQVGWPEQKSAPQQTTPSDAGLYLPVSCHAALHAATCRFLAVAHPRTDVLSLAAELPANHR